MKSKIYCIPDENKSLEVLGNGSKGLLLVINSVDFNVHRDMLVSMLKAIAYDIDEDAYLITKPKQISESVISDKSITRIINFDQDITKVISEMSPSNKYSWIVASNIRCLQSDTLTALAADKTLKINLWRALQAEFLDS